MDEQHRWHAIMKPCVLGLMSQQLHCDNRTHATANGRQDEQCALRCTSSTASGLQLVEPICCKDNDVDDNAIYDDYS